MIGKLINEDIEKMLPESLRDKYKHILETFHKMLKEWEAKDGVNEIRIGHELDKKILDFLGDTLLKCFSFYQFTYHHKS